MTKKNYDFRCTEWYVFHISYFIVDITKHVIGHDQPVKYIINLFMKKVSENFNFSIFYV